MHDNQWSFCIKEAKTENLYSLVNQFAKAKMKFVIVVAIIVLAAAGKFLEHHLYLYSKWLTFG